MNSQLTYPEIPLETRVALEAAIRREWFYRVCVIFTVFTAMFGSSAIADWRTPRSTNYGAHISVQIGSGLLIVLVITFALIDPWLRREVLRRANPNKAQEPTT